MFGYVILQNRDGLSGDVIVEALISNSSTFRKKTPQSQVSFIYILGTSLLYIRTLRIDLVQLYGLQEKYKLKKQKKHAPKLLLRRPSTRRYLSVTCVAAGKFAIIVFF